MPSTEETIFYHQLAKLQKARDVLDIAAKNAYRAADRLHTKRTASKFYNRNKKKLSDYRNADVYVVTAIVAGEHHWSEELTADGKSLGGAVKPFAKAKDDILRLGLERYKQLNNNAAMFYYPFN